MPGPLGAAIAAAGVVAAFAAGLAIPTLTPVRNLVESDSPASTVASTPSPTPDTTTVTATATATATRTATTQPTPEPVITPRPSEALALSEEKAAGWLKKIRTEDSSRVGDLDGAWVVQLSSKCLALTQADLGDPVGYPDGTAEAYPAGLGSAAILAYHLAMRERFGAEVLLVKPSDLDPSVSDSSSTCQGTPLWVSLETNQLYGSSDAALNWCARKDLPEYECGARPIGIPGEDRVVGR